jgi:hypothetical protein
MFSGCSSLAADINDLIPVQIMDGTTLNTSMYRTFSDCTNLTGSAQTAINTGFGGATPTNDLNTFDGCTSLSDYSSIHANWK